jgi:hypothetical protein
MLEEAQVVGFYSKILNEPFPTGTPDGDHISWTITVTSTDPDTIYYKLNRGRCRTSDVNVELTCLDPQIMCSKVGDVAVGHSDSLLQ